MHKKPIRTSTNTLHTQNDMLKITDHAKLRNLLIAHKVMHLQNQTNVAHIMMKPKNYSGRCLRSVSNFTTNINSYKAKRSVADNSSILWNNLPETYKIIHRRKKFKDNVKKNAIK